MFFIKNFLKIIFKLTNYPYDDFKYSIINHFLIIKTKVIIALFFSYFLAKIFYLKLLKKLKNYAKGRQYIDKCLNNIHIKSHNFFYNFPKFSVIIPVFNCENTIYFPIISIQNQNLTQYEIILINDFSKDRTSQIIERFSLIDKRIKIINNKRTFGTLYSRCIGTLIAKGKYIFPLDNDDMIFEEDLFDHLYKITEEYKYDIIGFRAVNSKSYSEKIRKMKDTNLYKYPDNLIVHQPELSTWLISFEGQYNPHDVTLWGKIFELNLYIKAINLLGIKKYSTYVSWAEDTCMNFIIFNIAQSFKYINKYGILHLIRPSQASNTQPINNKFFGELFLLEIIYDFSRKSEEKNYSILAALYIIRHYNKYKSIINNYNLLYLKKIIMKIFKSQFLNEKDKYKLITSFYKFLL